MAQGRKTGRPPGVGALATELARPDLPEGSEVVLAAGLESFPPFELLPFLAQARASGVLLARTAKTERSLTFVRGGLVWATSDEPAERLGEVAVRFGLMAREGLERELQAMEARPDGRRVGKRLVDAGLLDGHGQWRAVRLQLGEIFFGLLAETSGTLLFLRTNRPPPPTHFAIDVQLLLMDGARRLDELEHYRKRIPGSAAVPARAPREASPLSSREASVLELVDGTLTVRELGSASKLGEFEVTKTLHGLLERGVVDLRDPGAPGPAPTGPSSRTILAAFNVCLASVFNAVKAAGCEEPFRISVDAYLESEARTQPWVGSASLELFGTLPDDDILASARAVEPSKLEAALRALLDFALFQASEILGAAAGEALAVAVRAELGAGAR